jgi:hypothetical protein
MELNYSKIFNKEILGSVENFCDANNIDDKDNFIYTCLKQGFDIKKYGLLGKTHNDGEKDLKTDGIQEKRVEIEVIREIRVEVPVEVIKEVEKIIEVIKEVPIEKVVTKIEYISDKTSLNELLLKIQQLESEILNKEEELLNIKQLQNVNYGDNHIEMLQSTIQNLSNEVRELKKKNEELEKTLLNLSQKNEMTIARFHGSSNLNNK